MRRILNLIFFLSAFISPIYAQTLSGLPAASQSGTTLTITCPSPSTGSEIWRATGNPGTVTLSSTNWQELGTVSTPSGTYTDTTGVNGTEYGYTAVCTEGSLIALPTPIYFGTPSAPLSAGTLSGTTS